MAQPNQKYTLTSYISAGGQGVIIENREFLKMVEDVYGKARANSPSDDDIVVKLHTDPDSYIEECLALREASSKGVIDYVPGKHIEIITMKAPTATSNYSHIVYKKGIFRNVVVELPTDKLYVLYLKKLDYTTSVFPKNESHDIYRTHKNYNLFCWNHIISPLMEQVHKMHTIMRKCHRDIKADNIMLSADKATLIDFGLCEDETDLHSCGGTPDYMSPGYVWMFTNNCLLPFISRTKDRQYAAIHKVITNNIYHNVGRIRWKDDVFRVQAEVAFDNFIRKRGPHLDVIKELKKQNDYYALGLAIYDICNVNLPPSSGCAQKKIPGMSVRYPKILTLTLFNDCTRAVRKFKMDYDKMLETADRFRKFPVTGVTHALQESSQRAFPYWSEKGKQNDWIQDCSALMKSKKLDSGLSGGMRKESQRKKKAHTLRKVLGKNRKVYRVHGKGNTLFVKVNGMEITLKEAVARETMKHSPHKHA